MKKLTKVLSLALGALMMLGVGVGIRPIERQADAETSTAYTFTSSSKPANWTCSSTSGTTSYMKLSSGDYYIATLKDGIFPTNKYLSTNMDVEVSCGTFNSWSNPKSVKVTCSLLDSTQSILSTANKTYTSLTNSESAYKDKITLTKPADPKKINTLKIEFSDFTSGSVLRSKFIKLTYDTSGSDSTPLDIPTASLSGRMVSINSVANAASYQIGLFATAEATEPLYTQDITSSSISSPVRINMQKLFNTELFVKVKAIAAEDDLEHSSSSFSSSIGSINFVPESMTITEFLALEDDANTYFEVSGIITSITNKTHCNCYIKDSSENTLYIYGLKDVTDSYQACKNDEIREGDSVTAYLYKNSYEASPQGTGFLKSIDNKPWHVSFVLNGGSPSIDMQLVNNNETVIEPANPTKSYAEFVCWCSDESLETKYNFSSSVTSDLTLYAKWNNTAIANFIDLKTKGSLNLNYTKSQTGSAPTYSLVKDASTIKAGDKIFIAAKEYDFALSSTQNDKNRTGVAITKSNDLATFSTNVCVLDVVTGSTASSFAFYDSTNNGYLYACSSSSNQLKTKTDLDSNASWTISIADGVATITAQGTYSRNVMQYNPNNDSPLFACYASASQKSLCIYKQSGGYVDSYTINSVSLRYGVTFSKDIYDSMLSENEGSTITWGVAVSNVSADDITQSSAAKTKIECTPIRVDNDGKASDEGNFYQFYLQINDIPRINWETNIYAKAYVCIDGTFYFSNVTNYSVKTAAAYYVNNLKDDTAVKPHLGALKALLAEFDAE